MMHTWDFAMWMQQAEIWTIIGIVFIVAEVFAQGGILVSFGLAGLGVAAAIFSQNIQLFWSDPILDSLNDVLTAFGGLSAVFFVAVRLFLRASPAPES